MGEDDAIANCLFDLPGSARHEVVRAVHARQTREESPEKTDSPSCRLWKLTHHAIHHALARSIQQDEPMQFERRITRAHLRSVPGSWPRCGNMRETPIPSLEKRLNSRARFR